MQQQNHTGSGHNIARDFIDQTRKYIIQLKGKSVQEIMGIVFIVIIFLAIFLLSPGILIAALINNYLNIEAGQAWGVSIIASIGVFIALYIISYINGNALQIKDYLTYTAQKYFRVSILCATLMLLGHLFSPKVATMPHVVLAKMLGDEKNIKKSISLNSRLFNLDNAFSFKNILNSALSILKTRSIEGQWNEGSHVFVFKAEGQSCQYYVIGSLDTSYGVWSKKNKILSTQYPKSNIKVEYLISKLTQDSLIIVESLSGVTHKFSRKN